MENTLSRIQGDWIKIWKLKVLNKIKLFIRRCAHGFLPTRERLVMTYERDSMSNTSQVWTEAGCWNQLQNIAGNASDIADLVFLVLENLPSQKTN